MLLPRVVATFAGQRAGAAAITDAEKRAAVDIAVAAAEIVGKPLLMFQRPTAEPSVAALQLQLPLRHASALVEERLTTNLPNRYHDLHQNRVYPR
jgi:hypothetical protein